MRAIGQTERPLARTTYNDCGAVTFL